MGPLALRLLTYANSLLV